MGIVLYLDTILIPLSSFLLFGYHAHLWHCLKSKSSQTTIGIEASRRKLWLVNMKKGGDKKGVLAVQSLRNTQMATTYAALMAILLNTALASLINNTYNTSHHILINNEIFGWQSGKMYAVKFGAASLFLLVSFLCNSVALGYLVDATFFINICDEFSSSSTYTQDMFERGFLLALLGNRFLCMAFPVLMWMFGPLPVFLSSLALVWVLYMRDFARSSQQVATSTCIPPT